MEDIWSGIFGMVGVMVGVGITEILRRRTRIEVYSASVFDERLARYVELNRLLQAGYDASLDVMENPDYSAEERHQRISDVVLSIARFSDENELFLDEELTVHCSTLFMDAEEIYKIEDIGEREKRRKAILDSYVLARKMIREHSGVGEVDKFFKSITKPKLTSPVIEYMRSLRDRQDKEN